MRKLITFCATAVLILAATSAHADMTVIDFDSWEYTNLFIDDQFSSLGADFNNTARICVSPNPSYYPTYSGSNVIENLLINPLTNEITRGDIRIDSVGPDWTMAGGYVTGSANVTLTAYDFSDNKLVNLSGPDSTGEANTYDLGEDKPNMFLSFSAPSIAYVVFSIDSGNTFTVDDFTFNPVPVPAGVLLGMLGLGVAGMKLRKFV